MNYCINCSHLCHVASGLQNVKIIATACGLLRNYAVSRGGWRLPSG
ncbi:hypothetical protein LT85_3983 [Collimonas arenae]|uniref:Uncharacterized protein n=1 Tax=Collimonas arenae TaxID=279058 RepID=A0A0A1FF44_9BURK|nr:hypothetical protein LT85_3983 [Collimonas arenae]